MNLICQSQVLWLLLLFIFLPTASAMPASARKHPFPNVTFKDFSDFVLGHFSSQVSLATVLTVLFTMTENPELLSLHARQQNAVYPEEKNVQVSGWMKALARAMKRQLEEEGRDRKSVV